MNPDHLNALFGARGCITTALADGDALVLRVAGGCMHPDLADQTAVRLKQPRLFIPGDVVAFHCSKQNRLLVHRFLGYVWRRGTWQLMTMADRGARPDPLVDVSSVFGRVIAQGGRPYRIPPAKRLEAIQRYVLWCARYSLCCALRWRRSGP